MRPLSLRLPILLLAGTGLLSACAEFQPRPVVDSVRLNSRELTVLFTDGVQCRAPMGPGGGEGVLPNCPHNAQYGVLIDRQNFLSPVLGNFVSPFAEIVVKVEGERPQTFTTPAGPIRDNDRRI